MTDCIFCKIVEGSIPSYKVYEDDSVLAFLDINPVAPGHTVIIPKKHSENVFDIDEEDLKKIISVAKKIANAYTNSLGIDLVNILNNSGKGAQQEVMHFHMHVVPRKENDGLNLWFHGESKDKLSVEQVHEKVKNLFA